MEVLSAVVEVHCLACGTPYGKPQEGGTMRTNPGCPVCGYLGWSSGADGTDGINARRATRHFAAGRPHPRVARAR